MATIMCLSDEVIVIILGYNDLSIEDIENFISVWKQFRSIDKYDKYWEIIFFRRWPSAKKLYDKQFKENDQVEFKENQQNNKKHLNFMETGINCARQLRNYASQIIQTYYNIDNDNDKLSIDNFKRCCDLPTVCIHFYSSEHLQKNLYEIIDKPENFIKYTFFIDELKNLLTQSPRRTGCDLTERHFTLKLFHYMRGHFVEKKMNRFIDQQPLREQILERFATFAAQWVQLEKDVFYSHVKASLDNIAQEILNFLREKHPHHSIFSTSAETFSYWRNNNIDDNHWNEAEGTTILDTLVEYIFGKLNFRRCKLKSKNLEYMCIDNVLENKYGHQIILLIIYHSVARRLGLRCDIIDLSYPRFIDYCIFWKPKFAMNSSRNVRCFNISLKKFPDCIVNQLLPFKKQYSKYEWWHDDIFVGSIRKYSSTYRRKYPLDIIPKLICFRGHDINLSVEKPWSIRPRCVKFAVGMIVTHNNKSTDSCTGVIIAWHCRNIHHKEFYKFTHGAYRVPYVGLYTLPLNHCRNISFEKRQTNYIILTDNNKICYVEEDSITLTTPKWIDNSEIGRYFCKFEGTHYVPNKVLARLYPRDAAITAQTKISEN